MKHTTPILPYPPMVPGIAGSPARTSDPATAAPTGTEYHSFLAAFNKRFLERLSNCGPNVRLFHTDAGDLWPVYLASFPEATRQHHTCNACRRFIQRFGDLVTIDSQGVTKSAVWTDAAFAPAHYFPGILAMQEIVNQAPVSGVFVSGERTLGQPRTGDWTHLSLVLPETMVHRSRVHAPHQIAAERLEDYKNMKRALEEFSAETVNTALTILEADALYRAEKVIGPAKWLHELQEILAATPDIQRTHDNLLWRAVATAPPGFAHPRSSMIGTLLEDLAAGLDLADVRRKFKAKMDPLQYQRPQAAPAAGNIKAAEKLVEQMGIELSLHRRFAQPDEVQTIWTSQSRSRSQQTAPTSGVFAGITPKTKAPAPSKILDLPSQKITWARFLETVLPTATGLEVYLGSGNHHLSAFVTAVHPDSPPILQWDTEERRNPVSWYVWSGGSPSTQWGLQANQFHQVWGISERSCHWFGHEASNHGESVTFLIEGIQESRNCGSALFPEILKSELRPVRATIEAHSRRTNLLGIEQRQAAGLMIQKGTDDAFVQARVRVTTNKGTRTEYCVDRWI